MSLAWEGFIWVGIGLCSQNTKDSVCFFRVSAPVSQPKGEMDYGKINLYFFSNFNVSMTGIVVFEGAESNGINFVQVKSATVFEILARSD